MSQFTCIEVLLHNAIFAVNYVGNCLLRTTKPLNLESIFFWLKNSVRYQSDILLQSCLSILDLFS